MLKITALVMVMASSIRNVGIAATVGTPAGFGTSSPPAAQNVLQDIIRDPSLIDIPFENCTVKEFYKGSSDRLVIHIQDAHANLSGQQNLAKTLDRLMSRYGIPTVLVEGGSTDVTLSEIRGKMPRQDLEMAAKQLLFYNVISGEEYLDLTSEHRMRILGIEDPGLYRQNLSAYKDIIRERGAVLDAVVRIKRSLRRIKNQIYPKEILDHESSRGNGDDHSQNMDRLLDLAAGSGVDVPEAYTELGKLIELKRFEKGIDFGKANAQQAEVLEKLSSAGLADTITNAVRALKRSGGSQTAQFILMKNLLNLARQNGVKVQDYPDLLVYMEYLTRFADLKFDRLLEEAEGLERAVYDTLLPEERSKKLHAIEQFLTLVERSYDAQMSSEDFATYEDIRELYPLGSIQAFLNKELVGLGFFEDILSVEDPLRDHQGTIDEFYGTVDRRDLVFIRNTVKALAASKEKTSFLVTGGYHTQHLTRLLRDENISYIVLTPLVSSGTDHSNYEQLLLQDRSADAVVRKGADTLRFPAAVAGAEARYKYLTASGGVSFSKDAASLVGLIAGLGAKKNVGDASRPDLQTAVLAPQGARVIDGASLARLRAAHEWDADQVRVLADIARRSPSIRITVAKAREAAPLTEPDAVAALGIRSGEDVQVVLEGGSIEERAAALAEISSAASNAPAVSVLADAADLPVLIAKGLHNRPAYYLITLLNEYPDLQVWIENNGALFRPNEGEYSILELMMLIILEGQHIRVYLSGPSARAAEAYERIRVFLETGIVPEAVSAPAPVEKPRVERAFELKTDSTSILHLNSGKALDPDKSKPLVKFLKGFPDFTVRIAEGNSRYTVGSMPDARLADTYRYMHVSPGDRLWLMIDGGTAESRAVFLREIVAFLNATDVTNNESLDEVRIPVETKHPESQVIDSALAPVLDRLSAWIRVGDKISPMDWREHSIDDSNIENLKIKTGDEVRIYAKNLSSVTAQDELDKLARLLKSFVPAKRELSDETAAPDAVAVVQGLNAKNFTQDAPGKVLELVQRHRSDIVLTKSKDWPSYTLRIKGTMIRFEFTVMPHAEPYHGPAAIYLSLNRGDGSKGLSQNYNIWHGQKQGITTSLIPDYVQMFSRGAVQFDLEDPVMGSRYSSALLRQARGAMQSGMRLTRWAQSVDAPAALTEAVDGPFAKAVSRVAVSPAAPDKEFPMDVDGTPYHVQLRVLATERNVSPHVQAVFADGVVREVGTAQQTAVPGVLAVSAAAVDTSDVSAAEEKSSDWKEAFGAWFARTRSTGGSRFLEHRLDDYAGDPVLFRDAVKNISGMLKKVTDAGVHVEVRFTIGGEPIHLSKRPEAAFALSQLAPWHVTEGFSQNAVPVMDLSLADTKRADAAQVTFGRSYVVSQEPAADGRQVEIRNPVATLAIQLELGEPGNVSEGDPIVTLWRLAARNAGITAGDVQSFKQGAARALELSDRMSLKPLGARISEILQRTLRNIYEIAVSA